MKPPPEQNTQTPPDAPVTPPADPPPYVAGTQSSDVARLVRDVEHLIEETERLRDDVSAALRALRSSRAA
jgi:hypothetical protein